MVENKPKLVFVESCLSERRRRNAETIANTQRIITITIAAAMKGTTSLKLILVVFAVMPENDEIVDQEPFQLG